MDKNIDNNNMNNKNIEDNNINDNNIAGNNEIALSLEDANSASPFKVQVFEEELKEINAKYPLGENQVDIKQTYLIKNDDDIEVGIFIRNGLKNNLSIEQMPLVVEDENNNIVLTKIFNFKKYGVLPPHSARPFIVSFEIPDGVIFNEAEKYTIKFETKQKTKAFYSVATEIENMPANISFEEEKEINDFANGLETLHSDEFSISVYKLNYNSNQGIDCLLLLRNGKKSEANLEKLPISVVNENGVVVAHKVFANPDGIVKVSPNKAKLIRFQFEADQVNIEKYDLSNCKILYK